MPNLKEIRNRMNSSSSTKKITNAMKMVSAAKLRKSQTRSSQLKQYANKLNQIVSNITANIDNVQEVNLAQKRNGETILFVLISSNKGLCGSFNINAAKLLMNRIETEYSDKQIKLMIVGKKGLEILKSKNYNTIRTFTEDIDKLTYSDVDSLAKEITSLYENGKFDKVEIIYNQFKNTALQKPIAEQFLPIKLNKIEKIKSNYIFEPNQTQILNAIIPKSISLQLFKVLLESNVSENAARMTAMHKATDNANELIKELKLKYNKARQDAITKELLEIVAGAEALV